MIPSGEDLKALAIQHRTTEVWRTYGIVYGNKIFTVIAIKITLSNQANNSQSINVVC